MGYYTFFQLKNVTGEHADDFILAFLDGQIEAEYGPLNDMFDMVPGSTGDVIKWYDHDGDMMRISEDFPNTLFTLYGNGEDNDDEWVKYYRNGKMEIAFAEVTFNPASEALLNNIPPPKMNVDEEDIPEPDFNQVNEPDDESLTLTPSA